MNINCLNEVLKTNTPKIEVAVRGNMLRLGSRPQDRASVAEVSNMQRLLIGLNPLRSPFSPFNFFLRRKRKYFYETAMLHSTWLSDPLRVVIDERFLDWPEKVKILDFGCGEGRQVGFLSQLGFVNIVGHDVREFETWPSLPAFFVKYEGPASGTEFYQDSCFDIALGFQVLSCLSEDQVRDHLKEMARVLRRGGQLIIEDRNEEYLHRQSYDNGLRTHGRAFLMSAFLECGFIVTKEDTYGWTSRKAPRWWEFVWSIFVRKEDFAPAVPYPRDRLARRLMSRVETERRPLRRYVCLLGD